MRHFKIVLFCAASLLLAHCGKPYTVGQLFICNDTNEKLVVESSIVSALTEGSKRVLLQTGEILEIARTERQEGYISDFSIMEFVRNEGACVKVFSLDENGNEILSAQWSFINKEVDPRSVFNLSNHFYLLYSNPDGGCYPSYTFAILPEDIE